MKKSSSFIKKFSHDEERNDLTVHMKNGAKYIYHPVKEDFFNFLESCPSKGGAYNLYVKRNKAIQCLKVIS